MERENSVKTLKTTPETLKRTSEEKLKVKELGPDQPDIVIKDRRRQYTQGTFSRNC